MTWTSIVLMVVGAAVAVLVLLDLRVEHENTAFSPRLTLNGPQTANT